MSSPSTPPARSPEKEANQIRFETELEFVQCLANPHYLASLASQGLLAQPNFIAYLKYLTYWLDVEKGFARFIVYPHALHHLALLQQPYFRESLKDPELRMGLDRDQYQHWRTWRTVERNLVPTSTTHLQNTAEETDAPTPNPSRVSRRSGTARSSGARTPAGRTPRTIRTPGPGGTVRTPGGIGGVTTTTVRTPGGIGGVTTTTVRTPGGIGGVTTTTVRTPATRSALSVSMTVNDHMAEVGLEMPQSSNPDSNTTTIPTTTTAAQITNSPLVVPQESHQSMVVDSSLEVVNVDVADFGVKETSGLNGISTPSAVAPTIPPSTGINMDES